MSKPHWSTYLPRTACFQAMEWARTQPTAQAAWDACERGDWMLWLLAYYAGPPGSAKRKKLVLCACDCASLARKHASGSTRAVFDRCQRVARSWARNRGASLDDVRAAAYAAFDAASAAYAAAYAAASAASASAYAAAYAAASAASAAFDAASAASTAASAASASAAYAAAAAAYAATDRARSTILLRCAKIVRKHYPRPPRIISRDIE